MIRSTNESDKNDMAARDERLKQAREHAGLRSARAAAAVHGWPESTYRSHENGTRGFDVGDARRYSLAFGVRFEWLYYGRGRMVEEESGIAAQQESTHSVTDTPNATLPIANVTFPVRRLPVFGFAKGGPEGALILNGTIVAQVECLPGLEFVPSAYAVYVTGDSMEPRYSAGDTVYVNPAKSPRRGDYVVVQIHREGEPAEGYIKKYIGYANGDLVLSQLNPEHEIRFPGDIVIAVHLIVGTRTS